MMKEKLSKLTELRKSWSIYFAALLAASPDLLAFLPTVRASMTPEMYEWAFRISAILFAILRVKTQVQK